MNPHTFYGVLPGRQGVTGESFRVRATAPAAVLVAIVVDTAISSGSLSPMSGLAAYSILLSAYLVAEISILRAESPTLIWINPVALASALTIALPYVLTNAVYMASDEVLESFGFPTLPTVWMNKLMFQVVLAATAMWAGYRSSLGRFLEHQIERSKSLKRWLPPSEGINKYAVISVVIASGIARAWKIELGVYGYSASPETLASTVAYREYLGIIESLGKLALACVAMQFAASVRPTMIQRGSLSLVVGIELAFGLLSGFKSAVIWPFLIVGAAFYSQRRRVPTWLVPAIAASLMAGYVIIEPFREERNSNAAFDASSIASIAEALGAISRSGEGVVSATDVVTQAAGRISLLHIGSLGIAHAGSIPSGDAAPRFLDNLVLAPLLAVVPRIVWPSKPLQDVGAWYNREVLGNDHSSSAGMGPVTYLNYAGGATGVLIGFFVLGILQRGLFNGLRHFGKGGLVVLLGLLGTLSEIDSAFHVVFVSVIRVTPMLIVAQRILLRRGQPTGSS